MMIEIWGKLIDGRDLSLIEIARHMINSDHLISVAALARKNSDYIWLYKLTVEDRYYVISEGSYDHIKKTLGVKDVPDDRRFE